MDKMKRAIITIKGEVQRVGYRDEVERIARKLNIKGHVENLKPHDVKIICESEEKDIHKFIEQIRIQRYPISVEKIDVQYEKATKEFEYFEIKRGEWQDELAERFDVAGRMLYSIENTQRQMLGKQDHTLDKQDIMIDKQDKTIDMIKEGNENIGTEISDFHKDSIQRSDELDRTFKTFHMNTVQRFDIVDAKYGKISENMEKILNEMKQERKEARESMERMIDAVLKLAAKK